jgi:predicted RNA methylase
LVGVSPATIRNWVKAGHLSPLARRPLSFSEREIYTLKWKLAAQELGKLNKRANKSASANFLFPEEYADSLSLQSAITAIAEYARKEAIEAGAVMFWAALSLLAEKGELVLPQWGDISSIFSGQTAWRRKCVRKVMLGWMTSAGLDPAAPAPYALLALFSPHDEEDYLGLLYQSLAGEGKKSKQGSYFTPTELVADCLEHIKGPIETFLDPCCGAGKFLIQAANRFALAPENVMGFDIDPTAVNIARINLMLAYTNQEFSPKIHCLDAISELATEELYCETNGLSGTAGAIATNPPWGAYKNSAEKKWISKAISSGETFSLFIEKSIQLLHDGGRLSFILPESILNVGIHQDVRNLLLRETAITAVSLLGRQFTGVYTPVIRLDAVKKRPDDQSRILVEIDGERYHIAQDRFAGNDKAVFDVRTKPNEDALLKRIYAAEHFTLKGQAKWALGIVTGDNAKHLAQEAKEGWEPVYRGSDIHPYRLGPPKSYIRFAPESYQQTAKPTLYRAPEKLLYRFISKKLVFAYDDRQRLSLNSANILIPAIPGMSIKVVLAFLNSKVFQYIFFKKFYTHKVLRGHLEQLPFPKIRAEMKTEMERLADEALADRDVSEKLDTLVFSAFRLDERDISAIMAGIPDSPGRDTRRSQAP